MVALGIGAGLAFPSLLTLAMSSATPEDSGLVSGLVNTSQQVGGALGLSVLATLSASHTSVLRHAGDTAATSLTGGYHVAFEIGAIVVAVGVVLAVALMRAPRAPRGTVQEQIEDGIDETEERELQVA
jgi:MFS family permease